jgi:hypothetical protein
VKCSGHRLSHLARVLGALAVLALGGSAGSDSGASGTHSLTVSID